MERLPSPLSALSLLLLVSGCAADDSETTPSPAPPVAACDEHELALPDGSCIRPGVPVDGCSPGFVHDAAYGCEPTLPSARCPRGMMAVPGDAACRPVMSCGQGKWGDIPVDASTQYVDVSYTGMDGDGSESRPWTSIVAAQVAAPAGGLIAIAAGRYLEDVNVVSRPVRLWGVCPELVEVVGSGNEIAAVTIRSGMDGSEVVGMTLTGANLGIGVSGSEQVLIDRVHVRDCGRHGIDVSGQLGPTSISVRGSLIEGNQNSGAIVQDATMGVESSVVRGSLPDPASQDFGRGFDILDGAAFTLSGSLLEDNHDVAIHVSSANLTMDGSVIRATAPRASDLGGGRGINTQPSCSATSSALVCDGGSRSSATIRGSLIEDSYESSVSFNGSDGLIESTVIRRGLARAGDHTGGSGVDVALPCMATPIGGLCDAALRSNVTLRDSLLSQNERVGLHVFGSDAVVDGVVVVDSLPAGDAQAFGRGINVQLSCLATHDGLACDAQTPSTAVVQRSLIERSAEVGIAVTGAEAGISSSVVRGTTVRAGDGLFGDGVVVYQGGAPASVSLTNVVVDDSARAGVSTFGALLNLEQSSITCAGFSIAVEALNGTPPELVDRGGNRCGCPAADGACKAVSANLLPPEPIAGR